MSLWCLKHAPKNSSEFAGNADSVAAARTWALDWQRGKPGKPLLLYGPPGVGKTALALALAQEMGWELLEMNASDVRNRDGIERVLLAASVSQGLFATRKLVFIDEVDGLSGTADRGGPGAIVEVLRQSTNPVILAANDVWVQQLSSIRLSCRMIELKRLNAHTIQGELARISKLEGVQASEEELKKLSETSEGDLRASINDLQMLCEGSDKIYVVQDQFTRRDREQDVFQALRKLFRARSYSSAREVSWNLDVDHDLFKKWIEENLPLEVSSPEKTASAFNALSRADVFDGRIRNRQYWGYLRYSSDLMTAGVALGAESNNSFVKYQYPGVIKKLAISKMRRASEKKILEKIKPRVHASTKRCRSYVPTLSMLAANPENRESLAHYFDFDEEDLAFLSGGKVSSSKPAAKKTRKKK